MKGWLFPIQLVVLVIIHDPAWAFIWPLGRPFVRNRNDCLFLPCRSHDVSVTLPDGEVKTVAMKKGEIILEALEAHGIEAPHSCRTGLCTECAALVTANVENISLEAAVLDSAVSAKGFVLTCSATVNGDGVKLELGAGEKMYEAQYGEFRKGHEEAQVTKPGKWSIPLPNVGGA